MSKHSHAAILSIFAGIVIEHIAVLRDALAKLAAPGVDDEELHQFRVTLRRLHSAWVTFAPVLPDPFIAEWKPRLRSLAASTGPVREWDVLLSDWLPAARASLAQEDQRGRAWLDVAISKAKVARRQAWRALRAELGAPGVARVLAELESAVAPFLEEAQARRQGAFARDRAAVLRKKLLRRGRRPKRAPSPRLHRARITAKQWRYLYEAFYPALGVRACKRQRRHLRQLQDALGEVHDADVSVRRLAEVAGCAPPPTVVSVFHIRATAARRHAGKQLRWIRAHTAR